MTGLSQSDHAPPSSDQSNQVDQPDGLEEPSKVAEDSDLNNNSRVVSAKYSHLCSLFFFCSPLSRKIAIEKL
ncbi:hypothetical protein BCIN_13g02610 [Botrytis cinerea B05.10]|uniref:Uncharacterized protein n=1 Tax=Botryotinia fuckeliana (strain B05.10) TaxID=332648 RepID=A0A384K1C1_BOTFB|nr:hypothetical protein BCIN_13g02610 [Botrytis cinerea B05.10]ATZ56424.1 hypothetical protein BCIN_13g02610 [Botrytis cinerea B05.10]